MKPETTFFWTRTAGLSLLAFLVASGTATPVAVVIALMLVAVPNIHAKSTEKSAKSVSNSDYPALLPWALETTRHLPGHPQVAHALEQYVRGTGGFDQIEAPWDPSTVEEVERILEEAAEDDRPSRARPPLPSASINAAKITAARIDALPFGYVPPSGNEGATIDDVPGEFGTDEWARNRLAQLKAGAPPRFSDRVMLARSDHGRGYHAIDLSPGLSPQRKKALVAGYKQHRNRQRVAILGEGMKAEHIFSPGERELLRQARLKYLSDKPKHGRLDA